MTNQNKKYKLRIIKSSKDNKILTKGMLNRAFIISIEKEDNNKFRIKIVN